jgi:hypothetical protein
MTEPLDSTLPFFGLDATTGNYLLNAEPEDIVQVALGEQVGGSHLADLKARLEHNRPGLGVIDAVQDVTDLAQTGWGVVFAESTPKEVREALRGLLELRREQACRRDPTLYREYDYRPGESKQAFLRRLQVAPSGAVDPTQMPYYLLLIGDPEEMPFSFQHQLDIQYAVGRLHFDAADQYAAYAQTVVTAETGRTLTRRASFLGVSNPGDRATQLSARHLVGPLAERVQASQSRQPDTSRWAVETLIGSGTDKGTFTRLLGGDATPDLLFTASHGLGFPFADARQRERQGALVCQDWPGPAEWKGEIPASFYLMAEDIPDAATLGGLIAFHFACYGAGTPRLDQYPQLSPGSGPRLGKLGTRLADTISPGAFVARLPQRLLGHPRGGALAVVGHVERALGASFVWDAGAGPRSSVTLYADTVERLMRGVPVGAAIEPFNERYAELCADLTSELRDVEQAGKIPDAIQLAQLWTGTFDAGGFFVLGDPAVRLAGVEKRAEESVRPVVTTSTSTSNGPAVGTPAAMTASVQQPTASPAPGTAPAPSAPPPSTAPLVSTPAPVAPLPAYGADLLQAGSSNVRIEVDANSGRITVFSGGAEVRTTEAPVGDVAYGLFGGSDGDGPLAELRATLTDGLKKAAETMTDVIKDIVVLEVATYTSADLAGVEFDAQKRDFVGSVRRRALTRIRLDGETMVIVPESNGQIDQQLWSLHCQLVEQAQTQRLELIKTVAAAANHLLGGARLLG